MKKTIRHATGTLLSVVVVVALVASACGDPSVPVATSETAELVRATAIPLPPTATPEPTPTPEPTVIPGVPTPTPVIVRQPGLSNETIRLAVIFDAETQGTADNLFRDAWLGAVAWERAVNSEGGLGGRMVEVVPLDAQLFDHRTVLEDVCNGDFFAIVGSQSLGDYLGAELLGTEDCNIPDFPGAVYGSRRALSPVTFLSNPFLNNYRQAGPARYLAEKYPDASQNLGLFYYIALDLSNATERQREMLVAQGMDVVFQLDADLEEDPADRLAVRWEELGAESLVWTADPARLIEMLEALEEPPVFTLCEWGCYSQQFLLDGGEAVEGVYAWIPHTPFDSPNARGDLFLYRFWMSKVSPQAGWSEVSLDSWLAGRLFETAFNRLLQVEPEFPTREQLVSAAQSIEFYTANSILSSTNPGAAEPTPCFALMVVRNGRWEQEFPVPPRDKDCDEENLYELVTSRTLGTTSISAASSEDIVIPSPEEEPEIDLENPEEPSE